jgi:hypothetical protein
LGDDTKGGGQDYNATPEVIATIVAWKCTEKEIYTLYGRFARGGGVQNPNSFFKNDAECVKTFVKNSKKKGQKYSC